MHGGAVVWVKFSWNLSGATFDAPIPQKCGAKLATADDVDAVTALVVGAYASDPVWEPMMTSIATRMKTRIAEALRSSQSGVLCITYDGGQTVAASALCESHWTGQNFLTGICVLPAHQRRGIGTSLLAASLKWLQDRGLPTAEVFTEEGSIADRKIYPKFGSTRTAGVDYPDPPRVG